MKKYLFDKIEIHATGVKFIPYRKPTFVEGILNNEPDFSPLSYNRFLTLLSKTQLNLNNEYDIHYLTYSIPREEFPATFEHLLKTFAKFINKDKIPNREALKKFYLKAYQIKEEAIKDKEVLDKSPEDYVSER